MNAILYLIISFFTGYVICTLTIPNLDHMTQSTYRGKAISVPKQFLLYPVYFISGTVFVTWTAYILACVFHKAKEPLIFADGITMCIFLIFSVIGMYVIYTRRHRNPDTDSKSQKVKLKILDWIFLGVVAFLSIQLMWMTFFISHGQLYVGSSVFSDFSPHIGMIRSFSYGKNFPTMYSHFTGEDIRYHFMYQFFVGNLEFLGLRLDLAMNIPSIIGMVGSFLMLYVLAMKMSGKRVVGYLSCLFFAFRSSKSLFTFLANVPRGVGIFQALSLNSEFISTTTNESWGLWNLNVYCNQRHLAFTIPILLFAIIVFLPTVYESFAILSAGIENIKKEHALKRWDRLQEECKYFFKHCFFIMERWRVSSYPRAIFCGLLIGALSFWNGAVTITILLILFVMAIVANRKFEYLITAVIAVVLSFIQTKVFISGTAISPQLYFGFIAENRTLLGVIDYILRLTGILPLVLLLAFLVVKRSRRYIFFAFLAPFVFAFHISLTIDVTVNHKYIMLSLMLISIYAAILIEKLYSAKNIVIRGISIILVILLTATGVYDYTIVLKKNNPQNAIVLDLDNSLTQWVIANTDARDTILSSNYALNQVVLGGGMLFLGWPYFGWSAGYDTDGRAELVRQMFEADSKEELSRLITENDIRYIIVDKSCRDNVDYVVNEENIKNTYTSVYEDGDGEWKTTIYDTSLPK